MISRKARLGRRIEEEILKIVLDAKNPVSTREIALRTGRSWHAIQTHCMRLQIAGTVLGFQISNLNVWSAAKPGKKA